MITALLLILLAPLLIVDLTLVAEVAAGLARRRGLPTQDPAGRVTIIVPAHDEERVIAQTLEALSKTAGPGYEILVVADNCSDDTAAIARRFAARVLEREDKSRRGKGFALAFARERLRAEPPASVIVLDADCRTDAKSLRALSAACQQLGRPAQAINLLEPSPSAGPMVQLSTFAFLIKNLVRQRGLQRLAGSVHLTGTGMALPWPLFDRADLATSSIVEDIRLGIELGRGGAHPLLVEESLVWSPHADQSDTLGQRSRWEGGFLSLARAAAPDLLADGIRKGSPRTIFSALDLLVPPLAMLAVLNAGALLLLVVATMLGAGWAPLLTLLAVGAMAVVALLLAWWREGRSFISGAALARLPFYVLWKLPMYLRLARSGAPKVWQRTERPQETGREASPPNV